MKLVKSNTFSGDWLDKEKEVRTGDTVTIANAGEIVDSQYTYDDGTPKKQHLFKIKLANGEERNVTLNRSTLDILIDELGDETEHWVGKEVKVFTHKTVIGGNKVVILYLATDDWTLDDFGEMTKKEVATSGIEHKDSTANDEIPF